MVSGDIHLSRVLRLLAAVAASGVLAVAAGAQQPTSVAEAARRAREQKKQAPKAAREWNTDNIGKGQVSEIGATGESAEGAGQRAGGAAAAGPVDEAKEKERSDAEKDVNDATAAVVARKKELDLLQRDADLKRRQVFSSPDPKSDDTGRGDLTTLNADVDAKKAELQQAEQKLAEAKSKLDALNAELGPKPPKQLSEGEQRTEWANRIRPLREELARVEAEITRLQSEQTSTANVSNAQPPPLLSGVVGSSQNTGARLADLQKQRDDLRRKIAEIEDEARRAGISSEWVR